jgi:hypothetical protein
LRWAPTTTGRNQEASCVLPGALKLYERAEGKDEEGEERGSWLLDVSDLTCELKVSLRKLAVCEIIAVDIGGD